MKKIAYTLLFSAAISAPVFAASEGSYVLVETGIVDISKAESQVTTTTFVNPASITLGGGYRFNQNVGVEGGFLFSAESTIKTTSFFFTTTEKLKASVLHVAVVGTFPIGSKFDVVAKLGAASTKLDYRASVDSGSVAPGFVTSASASKTNLLLGLGGLYNITPHFGIRAEYQDFGKVKLDVVSAQEIGVRAFSVGLLYSF